MCVCVCVCAAYSTPKSYIHTTGTVVVTQPPPAAVSSSASVGDSQQQQQQQFDEVDDDDAHTSTALAPAVRTAAVYSRTMTSSSSSPGDVTSPSYDFISNPAKKAFFESSSPSQPLTSAVDGRQLQRVIDRSDVDINVEASINQSVHARTHARTH